MLAYKFTGTDGTGMFTGFHWPLPSEGSPGAWVRSGKDVDVCVAGVHAGRIRQLPYWLAPELWQIELAGTVVDSTYKLVAPAGAACPASRGLAAGAAQLRRGLRGPDARPRGVAAA
jgi:hypothetical protein